MWTWVSFVVFAALIFILGGSLLKRQSPASFMKQLFKSSPNSDNYGSHSKKALIRILESKDLELDSLRIALQDIDSRCGLGLAYVRVNTDALNLREKPTLNGKIITRIPNKSAVVIISINEEEEFLEGKDGNWYQVEYDGEQGWVWGNYLVKRY